jgi:hypothetical protein
MGKSIACVQNSSERLDKCCWYNRAVKVTSVFESRAKVDALDPEWRSRGSVDDSALYFIRRPSRLYRFASSEVPPGFIPINVLRP